MTRQEVIEKLKDIILFAMPNKKDVIENCTENSNLTTDVGLNSVGLLYIVIAVEEFFHVSFEDVSFDDFKTVRDVVDYILKESDADEVGA